MSHFLEAVIIQGHEGKQRRLGFGAGVNIISGAGSKGKSTVLHIIAYCLGADRCEIPVGKVRDFATWYFLALNVGNQRVVIGRRAPTGNQRVSEDAYVSLGAEHFVPRPARRNSGIVNACRAVAEAMGLATQEFRLHDGAMYEGMDPVHQGLETKDVLSLLLQPQDVIATRRLFAFFSERSRRERAELMRIALGVTSPKALHLRDKKERLERTKRSRERDARASAEAYQKSIKNLELVWHQATVAGVISAPGYGSPEHIREQLEQLKNVSSIDRETVNSAMANSARTAALSAESRRLRKELAFIRRDLDQIEALRQDASDANNALSSESGRLRVVDLLGEPMHRGHPCPLCGSPLPEDAERRLAKLQVELDHELKFTLSIPPNLELTAEELRRENTTLEQSLREIETNLAVLQSQEPALNFTEDRAQRERAIGALEQALKALPPRPRADSALAGIAVELAQVEEQLRGLHEETQAREVHRGTSTTMTAIARQFERLNLGLAELKFDPDFSTIEQEKNGRRDPLAILGGAEIHVMYHVAAFLGLHEYLSQAESPVPRLVVFDQPSQAYFPSDSDKDGTDLEAVRSIYDILFKFADRLKNRVQIIALDHADFSEADPRFYHARLNWLGEDGLIGDADAAPIG